MDEPIIVDVHKAKINFSMLVRLIETGSCREIIIARGGKPVARLAPVVRASIKLGIADGTFSIPDDLDALNQPMEKLFMTTNRGRKRKPRHL